MQKLFFLLTFIIKLIVNSSAADVLGCGGYIKSHVPIDFFKVVIKLYTKNGILKDETNCAPNNGYYFIPLYDKGDYVIKLQPPPGWSFNPSEFSFTVDGATDPCSQGKDINFVFSGFGITGKVESAGGSAGGPSDVEVQLKSNDQVRSTKTSRGGNFFFTPVYPGKYTVSISHPRWKIAKQSVEVEVTEGNTELPPKSLLIKGYDVSGYVKSNGVPVKDVILVLYPHENNKGLPEVDDCNKSEIPNIKATKAKKLCHVISNKDGLYTFPSIAPGEYVVEPLLPGQNVHVHFEPPSINFVVGHDSVKLAEVFEILGFSVSGLVLDSKNGNPVVGAKIFVNKKPVAVTDASGSYVLEKIQAGEIMVDVEADNLQFVATAMKLDPNVAFLPTIVPSKYLLCGTVISGTSRTVVLYQVGTPNAFTANTDELSGRFCKFLSAGPYKLLVKVSDEDRQQGAQFFPISRTVEVSAKPLNDIVFSQLKAKLSGKVQCILPQDCNGLKVILQSSVGGSDIIHSVVGNDYTINDVFPGKYRVKLDSYQLCWKNDSYIISVNDIVVQVPTFVQTGYLVDFIASHATEMSCSYEGEKTPSLNLTVPQGKSWYCIEKSGNYDCKLKGCHIYENNVVSFNGRLDNEVSITAQMHLLSLKFEISKPADDIFVNVNIDGIKTDKGPLKCVKNECRLELFLSAGETAVLVPRSDILYFTPPIVSVTGQDDCIDLGTAFVGIDGKVFQGRVIPPLAKVLITLETDREALMYETGVDGKYKFPPQDASMTYRLSARKDMYVLVGPDDSGNFLAHKLAEIIVTVFDSETRLPLQGAFLSLSGGERYRSNLQTNEYGLVMFNALTPGEYFLRPMMKEYTFEPSSKIVDVQEGATDIFELYGRRVAYSVFGQVISLNGEAERQMTVVAVGAGNCSQFSEESALERSGSFRIRGLQPYCSYDIRVESSPDMEPFVERIIPPTIRVFNVRDDVFDLKFVVIRKITTADILLKVYAKDIEHYKTLRLKVVRELPTPHLVHLTKLDMSNYRFTKDYNYGVLVSLLPIPADGKTYSIQLESSISQKSALRSQVQSFVSNSTFKYFELDFVVKENQTEQHMKQTSVWTLVFIFSFILLVYNADKVYAFVGPQFAKLDVNQVVSKLKPKSVPVEQPMSTTDIDQIVQSINAVKRKPKLKKI